VSGKQYEFVSAKQVLNRVKSERMPFEWSLNPYRGCAHGCSFCYARAFQTFLGREPTDDFQNHIIVKDNAAEALEAQLRSFARRHGVRPEDVGPLVGPVAIGTATDPYQPIEAKAEQTRRCLSVLAEYGVPTTVTTRSPLVLRDVDVLKQVDLISINISINTLDAALTRRLEPATPLPAERLRALRALASEGLPAGAFVAPILPLLTDDEAGLNELFAALKAHDAAFAMTSLLRLSPDVKPWYFRTLDQHFPDLVGRYARLYAKTYVDAAYAGMMESRLKRIAERHGLDRRAPERAEASRAPTAAPRKPPTEEPVQLSFLF